MLLGSPKLNWLKTWAAFGDLYYEDSQAEIISFHGMWWPCYYPKRVRADFAKRAAVAMEICDVEFFENAARALRCVRAFKNRKPHDPMGYILASAYERYSMEQAGDLETRIDVERKRGLFMNGREYTQRMVNELRAPTFAEIIARCEKEEGWPKHGDPAKQIRKLLKKFDLPVSPVKVGTKAGTKRRGK